MSWPKTGAGERDGRDSAAIRRSGVAGGAWARRVDDVEAVSAWTAEANVVWVVPCRDQIENANTQISSDL